MNKIKNIFNKRSKLLFVLTSLQIILTIWFLCYFNYLDRLNYYESITNKTDNLALLFQNMYTSTWWGLLILVLSFIAISSLVSFIYKDIKFQLISILLWGILLILAINLKDTFLNNLSIVCIFLPIIIMSVKAYFNQKAILNKE